MMSACCPPVWMQTVLQQYVRLDFDLSIIYCLCDEISLIHKLLFNPQSSYTTSTLVCVLSMQAYCILASFLFGGCYCRMSFSCHFLGFSFFSKFFYCYCYICSQPNNNNYISRIKETKKISFRVYYFGYFIHMMSTCISSRVLYNGLVVFG